MRTRGAIRVQAALGVIKERCIEVANKSDADRKEAKALFETKSADVRTSAKTEKFIECLDKPRRENRRQKERGVDKTCRVADRIPFKRTKADLHTPQLREELRARSLDFDAARGCENTCAMLKDFERNKTCYKPVTEFFKEMMQDETTDD
jgi:50S ribosomal subunit-associated GTPase HflX